MPSAANLTPIQPVCTPYHFCFSPRTGALRSPAPGSVEYITGCEEHLPPADLTVYNPNGLDVEFRRCWRQNLALEGVSWSNMPLGWTHNWDVEIFHNDGGQAGTWPPLTLRYPDGKVQPLVPVLDAQGRPTGELVSGFGGLPPVWFEGEPDFYLHRWSRITAHWACNTDWVFERNDYTDALDLTALVVDQNLMVRFRRNTETNALEIVDPIGWGDPPHEKVLLTISFGGAYGSVVDCYGRKVHYHIERFPLPEPYTFTWFVLTGASAVTSGDDPNPPPAWEYEYGTHTPLHPSPPLLLRYRPVGAGIEGDYELEYLGEFGRVSCERDPEGTRIEYSRAMDSLTQHIAIRSPAGDLLREWDLELSGETVTASTLPWQPKQVTYLDPDHVTSVTWHDDRTTTYGYDNHGNLTTVTDPRGVTTTLTYDYSTDPHFGRLVQIREGNGRPTMLTYDGPCTRVTSVTVPQPGTTDGSTVTYSFTYNHLGDVTSVTGPGNNAVATRQIQILYTDDLHPLPRAGQPRYVVDELGRTTAFDYDERGNVVSVTDPFGNVTTFEYDIRDQLVATHLPSLEPPPGTAGPTLRYSYRGVEGPLASLELLNSGGSLGVVQYVYGAINQLQSLKYNDQTEVQFGYDALYRLSSLTNAANAATLFNYTPAGWYHEEVYPGGTAGGLGCDRATQFDAVGRVLEAVDGSGNVTQYEYDTPDGQLSAILYPGLTGQNVAYAYDSLGRLATLTDAVGTQQWTYDDAGFVTQHSTTYTNVPTMHLSYGYWPDGSRRSLTTPAGTTTYDYDAAGALTAVHAPEGDTTYTYGETGLLARRQLPSGAAAEYAYGPGERLTELRHYAPDATLVARYYDIVFNAYEQLAGYQVEVPSDPTHSGAVRYTYDAFGQLSREESDLPAGRDHMNYEYDAAGNLRVWARDGDYVGPFWYNERDQLLSSWTHRHLLKYYSWRADGTPEAYKTANLLQAPEVQFDREQRLLSGIGPAEHRYRADGLRAAKVLPDQVTWYLYDGANLVCEMYGGGAVKTAQTWGPDGLVSRGGEFYQYNLLGDVAMQLDAQGQVVDRPLYDAWGNRRNAGAGTVYGYRGQYGYYWDSDTELHLLTWRWYDPELARFVTRDPVGYNGGMNLYGYCGNDPVNSEDPTGLDRWHRYSRQAGDYIAGVGDSLTFGATGAYRTAIGDGTVDTSSAYYGAGVATELVGELVVSGGSAALKKGVERGSRRAMVAAWRKSYEPARDALMARRRAKGLSVAGQVHHQMYRLGHPGGKQGMFPMIRSTYWARHGLRYFENSAGKAAAHAAHHRYVHRLELGWQRWLGTRMTWRRATWQAALWGWRALRCD